MIFWLAVLTGAMFAWIAVRIGFTATWIMFFHLILAVCVAIFLTPWVVAGVPAATSVHGFGYALTLMSIAIATMFIAYGACYASLSGRLQMEFPRIFDTVAAGFLGFLSGFLALSFLVFVFFLTPLSQFELVKRLGFDARAQETNTAFVCWWCDGMHWLISPLGDESTSRQAVDLLMAKAAPPETQEPESSPPPPPVPETKAIVATDAIQDSTREKTGPANRDMKRNGRRTITVEPEPPTFHGDQSPDSIVEQHARPRAFEELPEGALSGTWKAPGGSQFRINHDGKALTIDLITSDFIQSLKGKLIRRDTHTFEGSLNVVFSFDLTKRYSVDTSATIADPGHLRVRTTNWPNWDQTGKYTGETTRNEVWSLGDSDFVNPFDP